MARTLLNALLVERALAFRKDNTDFYLDKVLSELPDTEVSIKNVCAKVAVELSDEIDEICSILHVSKRRFLEAGMIEAVAQARKVMFEEGIDDFLRNEDERAQADRALSSLHDSEVLP